MKKKIIIAAATMFLLALLFPISAFAATHDDVDTWAELADAFTNDTDEQVTINLTGDIAFENYLTANAGQKYTISGTGYTLYVASFKGEGTVEINADIEDSSTGFALITKGSVDVTVTGDISSSGVGIDALDTSKVTVTGNVTGDYAGIYVDNEFSPTVTIVGNVTGDFSGIYVGGESCPTITVTGNVTGNYTGIQVYDYDYKIPNPTITVTGNVTGEYGVVSFGGSQSEITVTGNVMGTDTGITAGEYSTVTVNGNVYGQDGDPNDVDMNNPEGYSDGGDAVEVEDYAKVHVTGDVIGGKGYGTYAYGGDGVSAEDFSDVTVDGNVFGGDVEADPDTEHIDDSESYAGDAVEMDGTAIVKVGGDAKGGSTNADGGIGGCGITLLTFSSDDEPGSVTVQGNVAGEKGGTSGEGEDGEAIYVAEAYEGAENNLPLITVYSLTPGGTADLIGGNYEEYETMENIVEALKADINFFIRTAPAENGTVTADKETAKTDEVVTFTLTPYEGYKADSAKVGETALTGSAGVYTYSVPENGFVTGVGTFIVDENYVPNTGDSTDLVLYIVLGFAALMAMAAAVALKKKEN